MKYNTLEYLTFSIGLSFLVTGVLNHFGITGDVSVGITLFTFFGVWIGLNVNNATKYRTISCHVNSIEDINKFINDVTKYSETHEIQDIKADNGRLCAWFLK